MSERHKYVSPPSHSLRITADTASSCAFSSTSETSTTLWSSPVQTPARRGPGRCCYTRGESYLRVATAVKRLLLTCTGKSNSKNTSTRDRLFHKVDRDAQVLLDLESDHFILRSDMERGQNVVDIQITRTGRGRACRRRSRRSRRGGHGPSLAALTWPKKETTAVLPCKLQAPVLDQSTDQRYCGRRVEVEGVTDLLQGNRTAGILGHVDSCLLSISHLLRGCPRLPRWSPYGGFGNAHCLPFILVGAFMHVTQCKPMTARTCNFLLEISLEG